MMQACSVLFFALLFVLSVPASAGTDVAHDNETDLSRLASTGQTTDPQPIDQDNHNNQDAIFDFGAFSSKESDQVTTSRGLRIFRTDRDLKRQNGSQSTTKGQPKSSKVPQAPKKSKGPKGGLSKKSKRPKGIPKKSKGFFKGPQKVKSAAPTIAIKGKAKTITAPKQSKAPIIIIKGKSKTVTTADKTRAKKKSIKNAKRKLRTRNTKQQTQETSRSSRHTRRLSGVGSSIALDSHPKGAQGGAVKTVKQSFPVPTKPSKVPQAAVLPKQSKGPKGSTGKTSKAPAKAGKSIK